MSLSERATNRITASVAHYLACSYAWFFASLFALAVLQEENVLASAHGLMVLIFYDAKRYSQKRIEKDYTAVTIVTNEMYV